MKKILYNPVDTDQSEALQRSKKSIPATKNRKTKTRAIGSLGNRFAQRWFPDAKRGKT